MGDRDAKGFAKSDDAFAAAFRTARERAKITQADLAEEMRMRGFDFHQQTIYKIEVGKRRVTVGEGMALSDLVGVSIEDLTEVDTRSVRSLRNSVFRSATDYFSFLNEIAYSVAEIKQQNRPALMMWVNDYDKVAELDEQSKADGTAAERYKLLLGFRGLDEFARCWRALMSQEETATLLLELGFEETEIDEARRLL